jgi:hypothetical protein
MPPAFARVGAQHAAPTESYTRFTLINKANRPNLLSFRATTRNPVLYFIDKTDCHDHRDTALQN